MNVNTSEKNINNLINNNNITIPKLNTNIENNDYFKNKGIIDETTIFYDFLSINVNKNRNNILKSKNFYLNDIKYYTKYNINNPNNDFFLYENIVNNYYDISNKYICDLNISNLITDKYNKHIFLLEFIRNFYYFISTKDFSNNTYKFNIPFKYDINNNNKLHTTDYNNYLTFNIITIKNTNTNTYTSTIQFNDVKNFNKKILELVKPILTYHADLINMDEKINNNYINENNKELHLYALNISKKYDNYRNKCVQKILNLLPKSNHDVIEFNNKYLKLINKNYMVYNSITPTNFSIESNLIKEYNVIKPNKIVQDPNKFIEPIENTVSIKFYNKPVAKKPLITKEKETKDNTVYYKYNKNLINKLIISTVIVFSIFIFYAFNKIIEKTSENNTYIITFVFCIYNFIFLYLLYKLHNYLINIKIEKFALNIDYEEIYNNIDNFTIDELINEKGNILNTLKNININIDDINEEINNKNRLLLNFDFKIEEANIENKLTNESIQNIKDNIEKLNKDITIVEKTYLSEKDLLDKINNELQYLKKSANITLNNAEIATKNSDSILKYNDKNVKEILNIDLDNFQLNENNYNGIISKINLFNDVETKNSDTSVIETFIDTKYDSFISVYDKNIDKELKILADELQLTPYINLNNSIENISTEIVNFSNKNLNEAKIAFASNEIAILNNHTKMLINSALFSRILGEIENIKRDKLDMKRLYQIEKQKLALNELEYKQTLLKEAKQRLELEIKIQKEISDKIELNKKNKTDIDQKIKEINNSLEIKNKEKENTENLIETIIKKIENIEIELKNNDLLETEERQKQEILNLLKLNVYTERDIKNKLKIRYDRLEKTYEYDIELSKDINKIKLLNSSINDLLEKELRQIDILKDAKTDLDNTIANLHLLKTTSLTFNQKYDLLFVKDDAIIKNIITEIDEINKKEILSNKNITQTKLKLSNIVELQIKYINYFKILNSINEDENTNSIKKRINLDIQKLKLLENKLNKDLNNLTTNHEKIIKEKTEKITKKFVKLNANQKQELEHTQKLQNYKKELEKLELQESYKNKVVVEESLKLTNIVNNVLTNKKELLKLLEKIKSLKIKDLDNTKKYNNIIINDITQIMKIIHETNKKEKELETTKKISEKNLENLLKIKKEKIEEFEKRLIENKDSGNITYISKLQDDIVLLKRESTTEKIAKLRYDTAKYSYEKIFEKKLIVDLILLKLLIDKSVNKLIELTKNISVMNYDIKINTSNNNIGAYTYKVISLNEIVLTNELARLENIKERAYKELEYKKNKLDTYEKILETYTDNSNIKLLYDNEKNTINDLESDIKSTDINIKNVIDNKSKHEKNIDKFKTNLMKIIEQNKFKNKLKEETKIENIKELAKNLFEYKINAEKYISFKEKLEEKNINLLTLNPTPLSERIKNKINEILENKDLEFESYIKYDSYFNSINTLLNEINKLSIINNYDNYANFVMVFDLNYDSILDNNYYKRVKFINSLKTLLSNSLNIDTKSIKINDISKGSIRVNIEVKSNNYLNTDDIINELLIQMENPDSKLRKSLYGDKITEIINLKQYLNKIPNFNYIKDTKHSDNLIIHFPFKSNEKLGDNTFIDKSKNNKLMINVIDELKVNNIKMNYINLENTLLKVRDVNLYDRDEFTISFISILYESDNKQRVILSNGTINKYLNNDIINSQDILNNSFINTNIFSIGFLNNKLYVKMPCKNNKFYNLDFNNKKDLYVNNNEWNHWIITKNNNKLIIYKNLKQIGEFYYKITDEVNNICETDKANFNKNNLYIGGYHSQFKYNTLKINNYSSFKGGLQDLRIYDKELTFKEIKEIFEPIEKINIRFYELDSDNELINIKFINENEMINIKFD
tara:strand:- start:21267 stop:26861 length:5595 start_codon:yes stop_codon:yes gene_type:complete